MGSNLINARQSVPAAANRRQRERVGIELRAVLRATSQPALQSRSALAGAGRDLSLGLRAASGIRPR